VQRVFYANQLVGAADIRYVCDELRRDPGFEFYCLVDSVDGVQQLAERVAQADPGRRLNVLVEGGLAGGRCGVRDIGTAVKVAEAVRAAGARLALVGVEGFEGLVQYRPADRRETDVREFLGFVAGIAEALDDRDLFDVDEVLLTRAPRSTSGASSISSTTTTTSPRPSPPTSKAGRHQHRSDSSWSAFLAYRSVLRDSPGIRGVRPPKRAGDEAGLD
jgi:D-serine deaminase-like pyridoxal phosphate-dependent protein